MFRVDEKKRGKDGRRRAEYSSKIIARRSAWVIELLTTYHTPRTAGFRTCLRGERLWWLSSIFEYLGTYACIDIYVRKQFFFFLRVLVHGAFSISFQFFCFCLPCSLLASFRKLRIGDGCDNGVGSSGVTPLSFVGGYSCRCMVYVPPH